MSVATEEPKDFKDLVALCSWMVIEGITKGEPLSRVMHSVLSYARRWQPAESKGNTP